MKQYYKVAGLIVEMDTFGRGADQAFPYLIEYSGEPDIVITSNWESKKKDYPGLCDGDGEYLATGFSFYKQLLNFDGMMLHSSAVMMDGKAYLFSADCGTGKSTHTSIWRKTFGEDRALILNDDKPALRLENGIWYAYGTPWSGKTPQNINARVPLEGIAVIERAENNSIEPFGGIEAVQELLKQTARPRDMEFRIKILELLDKLIAMVPIWKLRCNMEAEAAIVSYEAMSGERWRK